jgi:hypothetical protein
MVRWRTRTICSGHLASDNKGASEKHSISEFRQVSKLLIRTLLLRFLQRWAVVPVRPGISTQGLNIYYLVAFLHLSVLWCSFSTRIIKTAHLYKNRSNKNLITYLETCRNSPSEYFSLASLLSPTMQSYYMFPTLHLTMLWVITGEQGRNILLANFSNSSNNFLGLYYSEFYTNAHRRFVVYFRSKTN